MMRVATPFRTLAVCMLIPCLATASVARARADELRGVWADAFSVGFKSTSQINSLVARAVEGRYNAIFAEVLAYHDRGSSGHGAYWNSTIVPKATDISGSIDPLAYLVTQAHAQGLEVHAWIVPYRVSTSWPPSGNTLLAAHPEWLMVPLADMGGGYADVNGKYTLDPGSPDVQEYLVSIVQELVTNYAIDGVNLDYIRYTQADAGYPTDESYEKSSLARFRTLTGYSGTPDPEDVPSWNDFRRRTINELVRRLSAEIPAITTNPSQPLRLTADLITFGNAPTYFENSDAYNLHQNWKYWMQMGWLDAAIPMNYKREYETDEALWYRNWINAAMNWRYGRHVFGGQGNYLNAKAESVTQMQYTLDADAHGVVNYCYDSTADENHDDTPETDWTWYSYVATNLFTATAAPPTMPWRDSATATEGVLWGRVTDYQTGEPIDGATVRLGTLTAVETDGNGYYVVTHVTAGASGSLYDLTVDVSGCDTKHVNDIAIYRAALTRQDAAACGAWIPGDMDNDGDIDNIDFLYIDYCTQGPDYPYVEGNFCLLGDADGDLDIDLRDLAGFQCVYGTE